MPRLAPSFPAQAVWTLSPTPIGPSDIAIYSSPVPLRAFFLDLRYGFPALSLFPPKTARSTQAILCIVSGIWLPASSALLLSW
jgi:hypothetical protein